MNVSLYIWREPFAGPYAGGLAAAMAQSEQGARAAIEAENPDAARIISGYPPEVYPEVCGPVGFADWYG